MRVPAISFASPLLSCATCNVNNYASRTECYRCNQPKAAVAAPSPQQLMGLLGGALAGHLGGAGAFMGGQFGAGAQVWGCVGWSSNNVRLQKVDHIIRLV